MTGPREELLRLVAELSDADPELRLGQMETTVLSCLVALPAQNLVVAGHQQMTYDWWHRRRGTFNCVIAQVVID